MLKDGRRGEDLPADTSWLWLWLWEGVNFLCSAETTSLAALVECWGDVDLPTYGEGRWDITINGQRGLCSWGHHLDGGSCTVHRGGWRLKIWGKTDKIRVGRVKLLARARAEEDTCSV